MNDIDYEADLFWAEDLLDNIAYEHDGLIRVDVHPELMKRVLKAFIFRTKELKGIVDAN